MDDLTRHTITKNDIAAVLHILDCLFDQHLLVWLQVGLVGQFPDLGDTAFQAAIKWVTHGCLFRLSGLTG